MLRRSPESRRSVEVPVLPAKPTSTALRTAHCAGALPAVPWTGRRFRTRPADKTAAPFDGTGVCVRRATDNLYTVLTFPASRSESRRISSSIIVLFLSLHGEGSRSPSREPPTQCLRYENYYKIASAVRSVKLFLAIRGLCLAVIRFIQAGDGLVRCASYGMAECASHGDCPSCAMHSAHAEHILNAAS